ncbi:MAG: hypothetical protein IJH25_08470 [Clostridia bacterium]|nr:hypothetical protein [Clostridia bacterium]MBQ6121544.1 hypothetical protein [Clostridia bacterium]
MNIKIDPEKKIGLFNPEFKEMLRTLNEKLQRSVRQLVRKDMSAATITLKIDIDLLKLTLNDDNAPTGTREAMRPKIGYKISSVLQDKDDDKGDVIVRSSGKELLTDGSGNYFIVDAEEASGQLSMFNSWDEFREAAMEGQPAPIIDEDDDDEGETEDEDDADL